MIPSGGELINAPVEDVEQPSRTYRLDLKRNQIVGQTDDLDAIRQAVYKMLQTERFRHPIYSFDYGHELKTLIGSNPTFMKSEVKRMLREAFMRDSRITSIEKVQITHENEDMIVEFTVVTQYGSFQATQEVN
jgi:phage baseplate assembly protein W